MSRSNLSLAARVVAAAALVAAGAGALAQSDKAVIIDSTPAFPAFGRWVSTYVVVVPQAPPRVTIRPLPLTVVGAAREQTYQPAPVILGVPELPLVGSGATADDHEWNARFNYQGVYMREVVLHSGGATLESRAMSAPIRSGERFKIRVSSTFDGVASIDQVVGDVWYGKRRGQIYPQAGMSVQVRAGETIDLPVGANEYFVMDRPAGERFVVSVRHARALGSARSDQPAYRQDSESGSSYLQLVPQDTYPALEQLVSQAR